MSPPMQFLFLFLCVVLSSLLSSVSAQSPSNTHFIVTAVLATPSNPNYGSNLAPSSGFVYAINGTGAAGPLSIILTRGSTYIFDTTAVPSIHPVYVTTSGIGEGQGTVLAGPYFTAGLNTYIADPTGSGNKSIYYMCDNHPYMGGPITVIPASQSPGGSSSSTGPNAAHAEYAVNSLLRILLVLTSVVTLFL